MSYILDALRRADSERERGAVPGLHAQPVPFPADRATRRPALKPWVWVVAGVSAGLLVPLAWKLTRGEPDAAVVASAPLPPRPSAPTDTAIAPSPVLTPAPAPPPAVAAPPVDAAHVVRPQAPRAAVGSADKPLAPAPQHAVKRDTATPTASPESRIPMREELPEEVRRQLPALTLGGSMYSENPASRMLIVNGQPYHENDKPAPELLLEHIKPRSAVLRYKGTRFEVRY
jgi:general secretion pathway protein B